jgi:methoxymalonate biosynthesis protein
VNGDDATGRVLGELASARFQAAGAEWEAAGAIPPAAVRQLAGLGLLGAVVPQAHGGRPLALPTLVRLHHVVAAASASLQSLLTVHAMTSHAIARFGGAELKRELLPGLASGRLLGAFALTEEAAGSEIRNVATRLREDGSDIVVDGRKQWVSFGPVADVLLVFGQLDELGAGVVVRRDSAGVEVRRLPPTLGLRAAALADITFTGVHTPRRYLVGGRGLGLTLVATSCLTLGRLFVAAGALGVADAAVGLAIDHAAARVQSGVALKDRQLVQGLIASSVVALDAARALTAAAAGAVEAGDPDAADRAIAAKLAATAAARRAVNGAVQVLGARGLDERHPVARYYRDAKVMELVEGSTEVLQTVVAAAAFRRGGQARRGWD